MRHCNSSLDGTKADNIVFCCCFVFTMQFSEIPWSEDNNTVKEDTSKWEFTLVIHEFKNFVKKGSGKRADFAIHESSECFVDLFDIIIYANGCNLRNKGYVSVLFQESRRSHLYSNNVSLTFSCVMDVIDSSGESRFLQSFSVNRSGGKYIAYPEEPYSQFGFERFIHCSTLLSNMDEFLFQGCLTIHCDITTVECFRIDSWHSRNVFLAMSCDNSITKIVTPENIIKYKIEFKTPLFYYLQSESRYFQCVAKLPMKEAIFESLYICEDEYNAFHKLGTFLSNGSLQHIEGIDNLFELYTVADKYEILRLKHMCAELMGKSITVENAADILALADMHCDPKLKGNAIYFIRSFFPDVKSTVSWTSLMEEREDLVREVLDTKNINLENQESSYKEDQEKINSLLETENTSYYS